MEESIKERLLRISKILHYFGQYADCNMLIDLGVLMQLQGIENGDHLREARRKAQTTPETPAHAASQPHLGRSSLKEN